MFNIVFVIYIDQVGNKTIFVLFNFPNNTCFKFKTGLKELHLFVRMIF